MPAFYAALTRRASATGDVREPQCGVSYPVVAPHNVAGPPGADSEAIARALHISGITVEHIVVAPIREHDIGLKPVNRRTLAHIPADGVAVAFHIYPGGG